MLDLRNMDCMELMRQYPDKHFDLAIVDPPYGIGHSMLSGASRGSRFDRYSDSVSWDNVPDLDYFQELARVSKNQIIWGANYFGFGPSRCVLIWDKVQIFSGSDFELAWTSFDFPAKAFRMSRVEAYTNGKIHPCQKPTELYRWLLSNYAKVGDLILDTHLGSGSIAIACHDLGFDLVGSELDADYFAAMNERISRHTAQGNLFKPQIEAEDDVRQHSLFPAPEASA